MTPLPDDERLRQLLEDERLREMLEHDYPAWQVKCIPRTGGGTGWWAYLRRELVPSDYAAGVVPTIARESGQALASALCAQGELLWQLRAWRIADCVMCGGPLGLGAVPVAETLDGGTVQQACSGCYARANPERPR